MKWPPTDLQLLEEIYRRYYREFTAFSRDCPDRDTKVYVPIDIATIARHFGVDGDIIHGRLYYHLDHKYGIDRTNGERVPFFYFKEDAAPSDRHQVQFPILASAVAQLKESRNQFVLATSLAAASLVIAFLALIVSMRN